MLKKIVLAGSAAAVVLGAGTAALAAGASLPLASSSTSTPARTPGSAANGSAANGSAAPNPAANKVAKAKLAKGPLRRALHAQWVTRDGRSKTTFITHNAIRGQASAVSPTAITIKALDGVSQTYAITSATKVHTRGQAKGAVGVISQVRVGDQVAVTGTGTSSLRAQRVLDATK